MDLQTLTGSLCHEQLTGRGNCLIYPINSVGCDAFALVKGLHHAYPHENAYSRRKRLYNLSRAVLSSRDAPGPLIVQAPPEEDNAPYLIACMTQFGLGEAMEDNHHAKEAVNSSSDGHFVAGLRADTKLNRRQDLSQEACYSGHGTQGRRKYLLQTPHEIFNDLK